MSVVSSIGWHASSWTILDAKVNDFLSSQNSKFAVIMKGLFFEIPSAKFQWYLLFVYFITVDLVTSPQLQHYYITVYTLLSERSQPVKTWKNFEGKRLSQSRESIRRFLHNKLKWRCVIRLKVPLLTTKYKKRVFGNLWEQFLWTLCKIS